MSKVFKHFISWFLVCSIAYFSYISLMANSLGLDRNFQLGDFTEGTMLSGIVSIILTILSMIIMKVLKK